MNDIFHISPKIKEIFDVVWSLKTVAIIGQMAIIAGLTATIVLVVRANRSKPRTFWYIFINRMRYIFYVGFFRFIWAKIRKKPLEDHPYNYSFMWLMENKIFIAYFFYVPATLELIYEMATQISTGYVFTKPANFFISSPIRSICTVYIFAALINEALFWKRKYLQSEAKHGNLIDQDHIIIDQETIKL